MPPSNKSKFLQDVDYLKRVYDANPLLSLGIPSTGMMRFGAGSRIPFRNPRLEALNQATQLSKLRDFVSNSWQRYLRDRTGQIEYTPVAKARIDEVGELIKELMNKTEPYRLHVKNLMANAKIRGLLNEMGIK